MIKTFSLFLFVLFCQIAISQTVTDKEIAFEKGMEAIQLMDKGNIKESIKLLKEAQKLDPERLDYPYEIAYAHYLDQNYKAAIKILEKNINHKDVTESLFQLLGNSYDLSGDSEKAFKAYDIGLEKFPNSGTIHLEKGNVYWGKEEYEKALPFYEKGIKLDPQFPSNYYRASILYCASNEEIWGMIYGEIFMNLERNSARTIEISKLLYDNYDSEISFKNDSVMSISFCDQMLNIEVGEDKEFKQPFCMIYELNLLLAVAFENKVDINSLDRMRTSFLNSYYENSQNESHPNALFSYQKKIQDAGHFEAYNHWLLMKGDEEEFSKWHDSNVEKWEAFVEWFTNNPLEINEKNNFHSSQY